MAWCGARRKGAWGAACWVSPARAQGLCGTSVSACRVTCACVRVLVVQFAQLIHMFQGWGQNCVGLVRCAGEYTEEHGVHDPRTRGALWFCLAPVQSVCRLHSSVCLRLQCMLSLPLHMPINPPGQPVCLTAWMQTGALVPSADIGAQRLVGGFSRGCGGVGMLQCSVFWHTVHMWEQHRQRLSFHATAVATEHVCRVVAARWLLVLLLFCRQESHGSAWQRSGRVSLHRCSAVFAACLCVYSSSLGESSGLVTDEEQARGVSRHGR